MQHDFNIANQGFPATRADINNAFQAIASNSSGATAPSTTYANMWWYDTTNNKMYLRNEADSAWIEVATIDQTNNEWQITTGQISAVDVDGISFKTDDGITRVKLDDSGNLLVGGTTAGGSSTFTAYADGQIHAYRGTATGRAATFTATTSEVGYFDRLSTDGDIVQFAKDGTAVGSIGTTGSRLYAGTGDTGLFFNDQVDSIDPWNTSTNAARDGAIDLGDGSRRFQNLYLSGGVYLGGVGAANALDDYEEGTWTVVADFFTTSPSSGATTGTGVYTKVGNNVTVWGQCSNINVTGAVGNIKITGLPFASKANATLALYSGTVRLSRVDIANRYCTVEVRDGESFVRMIEMIDNVNATEMTAADFLDANSDIFFTLSYQTA